MTTVELTDRALALIEGRDPDEVAEATDETNTSEIVAEGSVESQEATAEPSSDLVSDTTEGASQNATDGDGAGTSANEGSKDAATGTTWLSDEIKSLASSYGLSDSELAEFGSEAEARRSMRLIDKQFAGYARGDKAPLAGEGDANSKPAEVAAERKVKKLDREKLAGKFDEDSLEIVDGLNALVDEREQFLAEHEQLKQYVAKQQQAEQLRQYQQHIYSFHDGVDGLDPKRYGKSTNDKGEFVKLKDEHDIARRKLYESVETIRAGIVKRAMDQGKQPEVPALPILLKRAEQLAFGEELQKEATRKIQEKASAQSRMRRPVGRPARSPSPNVSPGKRQELTVSEQAKALMGDPDIAGMLQKFQHDNGTA